MIRPPRSMAAHALTLAAAVAGAATPAPGPHGLNLAGVDRSLAPGDDFFRYANGAWVKATEIPPDRSSYGPAEQLTELTAERTAELIRNAAAAAAAGSEARQIGDYYASFMDEAGIEKKGQKIREPALRQRIVTDGHAPAEYRADTVRNLDPWYEAFGVNPGQKLYLAPADRVRVW